MTSHSQLQAVQVEIESVKEEIQQTKCDLAKARADKEVDFLRKQLEQLSKKENILREKEIIFLRAPASARRCLPCHHWLACIQLFVHVIAHHVLSPHCCLAWLHKVRTQAYSALLILRLYSCEHYMLYG